MIAVPPARVVCRSIDFAGIIDETVNGHTQRTRGFAAGGQANGNSQGPGSVSLGGLEAIHQLSHRVRSSGPSLP